jgi:hypothetical protein
MPSAPFHTPPQFYSKQGLMIPLSSPVFVVWASEDRETLPGSIRVLSRPQPQGLLETLPDTEGQEHSLLHRS